MRRPSDPFQHSTAFSLRFTKARFFDSEAPHLEQPPGEWGGDGGRLTEFQKLLLLRAIREEKTVFAMRVFVQVCSLGRDTKIVQILERTQDI